MVTPGPPTQPLPPPPEVMRTTMVVTPSAPTHQPFANLPPPVDNSTAHDSDLDADGEPDLGHESVPGVLPLSQQF